MNDIINVSIDSTDHLFFHCPICDEQMIVTSVKTDKYVAQHSAGKFAKCTEVHLKCKTHGPQGWRKFYWDIPFSWKQQSRHYKTWAGLENKETP